MPPLVPHAGLGIHWVMCRLLLSTLPALLVSISGCDASDLPKRDEKKVEAKSESRTISQEDRELLEKMKARQKARAELNATPSQFIKAKIAEVYDKGIFNSYTRVTEIEFTNTTEFDVRDPGGKVTYYDKNEKEMATVPFSAKGEIRAGQTAKLKVTAGEITGSAHKGRAHIEHVSIDGSV